MQLKAVLQIIFNYRTLSVISGILLLLKVGVVKPALAIEGNSIKIAQQEQGKSAADYNNQGNSYADTDPDLANQAVAYYNRGVDYYKAGNKEKAIVNFKKALELSQDSSLSNQASQALQSAGS